MYQSASVLNWTKTVFYAKFTLWGIDAWWDANIDVEQTQETGSEVADVNVEPEVAETKESTEETKENTEDTEIPEVTETKESTEDTETPEVTETEADMQDMEGGQMR